MFISGIVGPIALIVIGVYTLLGICFKVISNIKS